VNSLILPFCLLKGFPYEELVPRFARGEKRMEKQFSFANPISIHRVAASSRAAA
jgi:hypothetical protein